MLPGGGGQRFTSSWPSCCCLGEPLKHSRKVRMTGMSVLATGQARCAAPSVPKDAITAAWRLDTRLADCASLMARAFATDPVGSSPLPALAP